MHYEMMTVTPELAQRWLETKNIRNRTISEAKVNSYAFDMSNGKWKQTHQNAIAFYKDGNIADGQHRLSAIVKSQVPVDMLVWWGLEDQASYGIDAHKMRTTHDQIKIAGGASWINKEAIAIARIMMRGSSWLSNGSALASPQMIVSFCENHEHAIRFVLDRIPKSSASAPVKAAVSMAYYHENHSDLSEWCEVMVSGIGVSHKSRFAIYLRERLLRDDSLKAQAQAARERITRLAMRSIQAFCAEESVSRIQEPKERIYELPA